MDASSMFYGVEQARITAEQITARPFQRNKDQVVAAMNEAFEFYYRAHQAAMNLGTDYVRSNVSRYRFYRDIGDHVQTDLRDAATTKHIMVVGWDLKSCFEHLAKNQGYWRDDTWDGRNSYNIPAGISAFLTATDERGIKITNTYNDWKKQVDSIRLDQQAKSWKSLGSKIGYAQKTVDYIGPWLWSKLKVNDKSAKAWSGLMSKYLEYGKSMHENMDTYIEITTKQNIQEHVVAEVAAQIVGKLPIFGDLYANVIRGVPDLVDWFRRYAATQSRAIDMVGR